MEIIDQAAGIIDGDKKLYSAPLLQTLGEISKLTTGGSSGDPEAISEDYAGCPNCPTHRS